MPTRVAAVDLGTNSTRLLVADVRDGRIEELARETTITRLGEGVDARGKLLPLPVARVRNCLSDYRRQLEALGAERTLAIATSAVRDAENGEAFLGEIEWSYGFSTRLLSGHDEALLTMRGVTAERPLAEETLVLDVGGGSTELVAGGPNGVRFHVSLDAGCVRMTERFGDLDESAAAVRALLAEQVPEDLRPRRAIGVAGTVTTLAALDLELAQYDANQVHGHVLTRDAVTAWTRRLAAMSVEERAALPSMLAGRAEVIVAGAVIVREVLEHFALDELETSERDILDGAALEAAELPEHVEGDAPPGAYTCC